LERFLFSCGEICYPTKAAKILQNLLSSFLNGFYFFIKNALIKRFYSWGQLFYIDGS